MITFNADEVFVMAGAIERNGAKFYRKAAESADDESRDLLLRLAAKEDEHEKTFAGMRAELSDHEKYSLTPDPDNEEVLYLQATVDGKIFTADPAAAISGSESITDIIDIALGLEKDSIVFYQSMKNVVPEGSGKDRLDAIIREEIGHILDLINQLESLKK